MSWAKFDDQYYDHSKIVEVGPLGMALHTAATCYCARHLTDGFVPAAMLPRLINLDGIYTMSNGVSNAVTNKQITDELTRVGLFEVVPGGFRVHDYLDYNPPAEQVKHERAENAARQASWKATHPKKHTTNAVSNGISNSVTNGTITASRTRTPPCTPLKKDIGAKAPRKPMADERTKTPAIQLVREITGKLPNKALYAEIIKVIGEKPDREKAENCYHAWVERGYNPGAMTWLTQWYVTGIPGRNGISKPPEPAHKYREEF
jgi:hypothetical protein